MQAAWVRVVVRVVRAADAEVQSNGCSEFRREAW
jgi:hypothetical protein